MSRNRDSLSDAGSGKLKVRYKVHVVQRNRRSRLVEGAPPPAQETKPEPQGRVPRIARLLALAHHIQELLDTGQVKDLAEVARFGHVTRARVTQIMNLLMLAPYIKEQILHFPRVTGGHDPIHLRQLQTITLVPDWRKQRLMWKALLGS